jgi:lipoprotein-anchoring transpeptidase ErfK/SrfK
VVAGVAAAVGALVLADGAGLATRRQAPAELSAALPAPPVAAVAAPPDPPLDVPARTLLATPQGTIPTSAAPGGPPTGTTGVWYGYRLVLPVLAQRDGWSQVRLPQRPNGSTAWVADSQVQFTETPYYIRVSLSALHLTVFRGGQPLLRFPVGVGTAATPTVTGRYFVAVHQPGPDPLLGPVVLDLSAHSDVYQTFDGGNDAIIAIHGPVGAEEEIGTTGARLSNGCIRLSDADDTQLAPVPAGTPVDITP